MSSLAAVLLFALYSVPSNSVIPLPHEPGVLYFALYAPAWAIAIAGTVGTFAAAYADGFLVRWALDRPGGERLRADPTWQRLADWLTRWPLPTLAVVAFAGIPPIQVVRVLVLSTSYSRHRYALAVALGRFPRFYLLAVFGQLLSPPPWVMTALTLAFVAWAAFLVIRGARRRKPSASRPPS